MSSHRNNGDYTQITYVEHDQVPKPQYVSMQITGWVPDAVLTKFRQRHFYHLIAQGEITESWTVLTDNHSFELFWAPINKLPEIVSPQNNWLKFLAEEYPTLGVQK